MSFPNLFCVGFPKAGTSSLCSFFRKQDGIFVPSKDQPNYLCFPDKYPTFKGIKDQLHAGAQGYSNMKEYLDAYQHSSTNRYRADVSPFYLYRPHTTAAMIKTYASNPKIIICIRHPVDASFSMYKMLRRDRRETSLTYQAAYNLSYKRVNKLGWEYAWDYSSRYLYYDAIKVYLDTFDYSNILFLHFDELKSSHSSYCAKISSFLNIDLDDSQYPHVNQSQGFKHKEGLSQGYLFQFKQYLKSIVRKKQSTLDFSFRQQIYNSYFKDDYEKTLNLTNLTTHLPIQ